jgi:flavodoxin
LSTSGNVKDATAEDMAQYTILILAAPTWYDGEMQADWEDFHAEVRID